MKKQLCAQQPSDLRDAFIKYTMKAVHNRKKEYLARKDYRSRHEELVEIVSYQCEDIRVENVYE